VVERVLLGLEQFLVIGDLAERVLKSNVVERAESNVALFAVQGVAPDPRPRGAATLARSHLDEKTSRHMR